MLEPYRIDIILISFSNLFMKLSDSLIDIIEILPLETFSLINSRQYIDDRFTIFLSPLLEYFKEGLYLSHFDTTIIIISVENYNYKSIYK